MRRGRQRISTRAAVHLRSSFLHLEPIFHHLRGLLSIILSPFSDCVAHFLHLLSFLSYFSHLFSRFLSQPLSCFRNARRDLHSSGAAERLMYDRISDLRDRTLHTDKNRQHTKARLLLGSNKGHGFNLLWSYVCQCCCHTVGEIRTFQWLTLCCDTTGSSD